MASPAKSLQIIVGVLLLCGVLVWLFPCPTEAQMFILRLALAFGLAVCGSIIPGFFTLSIGTRLRIGTGLILFIICFLLTPRFIQAGDCRATTLLDGYVQVDGAPADAIQIALWRGHQQTISDAHGYFALQLDADRLDNEVTFLLSGGMIRDSLITFSKGEIMSSQLVQLSLRPALHPRREFSDDFSYFSYRYIMAVSENKQEGASWRAKANHAASNPNTWLQIAPLEAQKNLNGWQQALIDTLVTKDMYAGSHSVAADPMAAYWLARAGYYSHAKAFFATRLLEESEHPGLSNNLAVLDWMSGRHSEARQQLDSLTAAYPQHETICTNHREANRILKGQHQESICRDGSRSRSVGSGTCSHHGGVREVITVADYDYPISCD